MLATTEVTGLKARGSARVLRLADGGEIGAHSIVLATGVAYRRLDAPGLDELSGRGVFYGAAATEAVNCQRRGRLPCRWRQLRRPGGGLLQPVRGLGHLLVRGESLARSMSQYLIDQIERIPERLRAHLHRGRGRQRRRPPRNAAAARRQKR